MKTRYNLPKIEILLSEGFSVEELLSLCFTVPEFRSVYDRLNPNMSKSEIIRRLLEYVQQRSHMDLLLETVEGLNPNAYRERQPYKELVESPVVEPPPPGPGGWVGAKTDSHSNSLVTLVVILALVIVVVILVVLVIYVLAILKPTSVPTGIVPFTENGVTSSPTCTPTPPPTASNTPTLAPSPTDAPSPTATATAITTSPSPPTDTPTEPPTHTPTRTSVSIPVTVDPTVVARALPGVTRNDEWEPYVQAFDGVDMVLVPVGCFMMGSESGQSDERPVHQVCFDEPFWIDRYEVTNGQFDALGGDARTSSRWPEPDHPRVNVAWVEADSFCQSRGARLPTEAEWEYAAAGPESWTYPWGSLFSSHNTVCRLNSEQPAPVGSRPNGGSWVGALDMSGNVYEWTATAYGSYEATDSPQDCSQVYECVMRGGACTDKDPAATMRTANRIIADARRNVYIDVGFRCVRDVGQLP